MTNTTNTIEDSTLDKLVVRARSDRVAFGKLYDQIYPDVFKYCIRRTGNRNLAEEITSTVFLKVARNIKTFSGANWSDFRRWVFTISTNEIHALYRKTSKREALLNGATQNGVLGQSASDKLIDATEELHSIQTALQDLPERDQTIISLRFFSDMPYDDIGVIVGISASAARTAAKRALDKIRLKVER